MVVTRAALGHWLVPIGRPGFDADRRGAHSTSIYDQEWSDNPRGLDLCPQMPRTRALYHASSEDATAGSAMSSPGPLPMPPRTAGAQADAPVSQ